MIDKESKEKSNHKDYLNLYWKNRNKVVENEILPCQESIFELFSVKFNYDANEDLKRNRKKLFNLGKNCSKNLYEIHSILTKKQKFGESYDEDRQEEIVQEIVNMTYQSVLELFETVKEKFSDNPKIEKLLQNTCDSISEMLEISKNHTNIISQQNTTKLI